MRTADPHIPAPEVDQDFFGWEEQAGGGSGSFAAGGRMVAHRVEAFHTVHTASMQAVRELLPSEQLRPARWSQDRGLVFVAALHLRDVTTRDGSGTTLALPPFAAVAVGVLPTAPSDVPRLAPYRHPLRGFVLHLAVTDVVAARTGRAAGLPAFVADLAVHDSPHRRHVAVTEAGHGILELRAHVHGHARPEHSPVVLCSALDGQLVQMPGRFFGHRQLMLGGDDGAFLLPGLHPVAEHLRALRADSAALVTVNHVGARMVLDGPRSVGEASVYAGHLPDPEQSRGRWTVAYPDTPPLDQYAAPADEAVEVPPARRLKALG
ncbi:acetoacetate decarboxylase family protein [Ornithinimicrobium pekingense]|uniref:Uncharacterized protein n=1 Tax=Ornithinimicrobium pekingense TaxID=384677 RepID=A0ABQ2FDQ7_9MICO|nr:acetoacetate decarboxylase family protein [Ornithinimicrobium pekingense]GGK77596.1 hypothetical protein GCM10011509_27680 [Ornithinimicrobium pekingense]